MLSQQELQRYARHLVLPEVGEEGQEKLKSAKVLIIGAGGLGSPAALYLAAAGIGTLGIVDYDVVNPSNLQRQLLHTTDAVKKSKVESAKKQLNAMNPHVNVELHESRLTSDNAISILKEYDIIVDGSDNFPTRYLVNDACVLLKKPNVYGSVFRFHGQTSIFCAKGASAHGGDAARGPCYRCVYPEPPAPHLVQNCEDAGVLGVLPGIIGTIQAAETIKLILGIGTTLIGRMLLFDALNMQFQELQLKKNPECPVCGTHPTVTELIDYEEFCGMKEQEASIKNGSITVEELKSRMDRGENIFILDVREPDEYRIVNIGGYLIPLNELPRRVHELDSAREIVVHCHHGSRSAYAVELLQQMGFANVKNLKGGIEAWAMKVDRRLARY